MVSARHKIPQYFPLYSARNVTLRPNEMTQRDVLAGAVSELLWKVQIFMYLCILKVYEMFLDWWRLRCGGRHPRGEPCVRGASKVFHRWSHRKSKFDEK